jgi:hypothetical protein
MTTYRLVHRNPEFPWPGAIAEARFLARQLQRTKDKWDLSHDRTKPDAVREKALKEYVDALDLCRRTVKLVEAKIA